MFGSSLAPKWSKPVPFCGMDHQKSIFLLISDTLSVGGCWGQPMLFFWKLVDETQISKPSEAIRHHNLIKKLILLPLRADLLCILHYEIPCILSLISVMEKKFSLRSCWPMFHLTIWIETDFWLKTRMQMLLIHLSLPQLLLLPLHLVVIFPLQVCELIEKKNYLNHENHQ